MSISIGVFPPESVSRDVIAIGSFHAFKKGVLVSASAGNIGIPGTVVNAAPWILTVAASSIDREFNSDVYLGNSKIILKGSSLNPLEMDKFYEIIDATAAAAAGVPAKTAGFCKNNTLDNNLIKGKIVVCTVDLSDNDNIREKGVVVREGGGVGMILTVPSLDGIARKFDIPATLIGEEEAKVLQEYLTTTKMPTAKIYPTMTVLKTSPAPKMATFSSMGPSYVTPQIIKPDITAPGLNILAAWSPLATEETAGNTVDYNIISGTSMSCPHISAIAAIVKSYHPSWSPAAIKSAIMTTATVLDNTGKAIQDSFGSPATPFNFGSGHVNPKAALDPGLVYDFDTDDIINFLCSSGALSNCNNQTVPPYDLNYPSIAVTNMNGSVSVLRTVTYYGKGPSVFTASVEDPAGVKVAVTPNKLEFKEAGEKMSFKVNLMADKMNTSSDGDYVFGSMTWSNGIYNVRSPIGVNVASA